MVTGSSGSAPNIGASGEPGVAGSSANTGAGEDHDQILFAVPDVEIQLHRSPKLLRAS